MMPVGGGLDTADKGFRYPVMNVIFSFIFMFFFSFLLIQPPPFFVIVVLYNNNHWANGCVGRLRGWVTTELPTVWQRRQRPTNVGESFERDRKGSRRERRHVAQRGRKSTDDKSRSGLFFFLILFFYLFVYQGEPGEMPQFGAPGLFFLLLWLVVCAPLGIKLAWGND